MNDESNEPLTVKHSKGFEGGPFVVDYVGRAKMKLAEIIDISVSE